MQQRSGVFHLEIYKEDMNRRERNSIRLVGVKLAWKLYKVAEVEKQTEIEVE
jgi:hypothetical protein